jgi:hypothetical protein
MSDARIDLTMQLREPNELQPRFGTALVPRNSISGRALVAVVAIMTFLVSLTTGAAILVTKAAGEWQSDISREMTIQIMPAPGRDLDTSVNRAVAIARAISGLLRYGSKRRIDEIAGALAWQRNFAQRAARSALDCHQDCGGRDA